MNTNNNTAKLIMAAMFAALTCVATMVIRIPTIGTNGYVNIGDTIVLLSAWMLGLPYGALAAGLGSALADLLAAYASYVPGTFLIKFLMAFAAAIVFGITKKHANRTFAHIVTGVIAEIIMVVGYFLYESTLLGYGLGAAASIPSNIIQGVTCLVLALVLVSVLSAISAVTKLFPAMK